MSPVKKFRWALRRTLGLRPMQKVMRELERRDPGQAFALARIMHRASNGILFAL
jgi:hypothetical protein